jgi:phenylalanyl-tRNA synthetase beta chain
MKISLSWIQDFVDLPNLSPLELSERLTLGTAEVEEVSTTGLFWKSLKVAVIRHIEKHPEADKLNLVTFSVGEEGTRQVVCGASNVRVGLKTVFAPTGVTLPIGLTLEPKKIRGILSEGMLCSEEELALSESSAGIIELPEDAPVGAVIADYWKKSSDIILDIDNKSLTHRPDLWGHFGFAREFAALYELPLRDRFDQAWMQSKLKLIPNDEAPMQVKVEGESAALCYFGLSVDDVAVTESPAWMKARLEAAGLRSLNSIVDISNYVMLELGLPLHLFDRSKIKGSAVKIHALETNTNFMTLDEIDRALVAGDTVISDEQGPLVLAGIMGGMNSGVDEKTTKLFIEVANWKAAPVRRTSTRLGLRTDSSQRYEKSLDSKLALRTMLRTLELILELNPKARVVGRLCYDGQDLESIKPLEIKFDTTRANKVLGLSLSLDKMKDIFERLAFQVQQEGSFFHLTVPSFRATKDIECEADCIEELGRVVGYGQIQELAPALPIAPTRLPATVELHRKLRDFMVLHAHALELNTYPLIGKKLLERAHWPNPQTLILKNALSVDHNQMRPSLIPSLLEVAALNAKHQTQASFFELGRVYHAHQKNFSEEQSHLAHALYHHKHSSFTKVVSTLERLMLSLNIPYELNPLSLSTQKPKDACPLVDWSWPGLHPFEVTAIKIMGRYQGIIFSVHPHLLRSLKIKGHLTLGLINLSAVEGRPLKDKTKYTPLAKFPGSTFDCTVIASKDHGVQNILDSLKDLKKMKEWQGTKIVDIYPMSDDQKSVTLRTIFQNPEATMTGEFLTQAQHAVISALDKAGFPLKM